MEQPTNTVSVTVYTAGGLRSYLNFELMSAAELDSKVAELGYLATAPGVEAGEVVEPILYVCRYDHFDKNENKDVPHIAFYSESEWLTKRWLHKYLDKPEDVEAFEAATGLTVAKMPVWMGETHPERNNPKAQQFIVRLPKAIRIARSSYTTKEGDLRHKLKRYVDTIGSSKPQAAPPASAGKQDTGSSTDDMLMGYTKHMYVKNPSYQTESIKTLRANGVLTTDMKPFVAACHVFMHRVHADYMIADVGVKEILGCSLKDYLAQDGHNLETAWNKVVASELATTNERQLTS